MGYRSDVAYVIKFKDKESLEAFKVSTLFEDKDMREAMADCETVEKDDVIRYTVESVKWYPDYPEVKAHHRLIEAACDEPFNANARMIRIGEELDDIECEDWGDDDWCPWDYIEVIRSLQLN